MKGFQDDTLDISDGVIFQVSYMAGGKQLYKDFVANGDNVDLTQENIKQFIDLYVNFFFIEFNKKESFSFLKTSTRAAHRRSWTTSVQRI